MTGRFIVAQMKGCSDAKENLRRAEAVMKRARDEYHADLILFPETFMSYVTSAVSMKERVELAQKIEGTFVQEMKRLSKAYGLWVVFGMRESAGEKNYNTIIMTDADGEIVKIYHKTHLYDAFSSKESDEFIPGEELFTPLETPFGRLGLFVCYEARFPEIARRQALAGAQILLMPTAWVCGERKKEQLQILSCARALENTVYLLVSNLCGGSCTGGSMIIDPLGKILSEAGQEEELLYVEVDTDEIEQIRNTLPSLKNRRPELY